MKPQNQGVFAWRISVNEQLEVNASGFVVLMMFNIAHPQLAPNLTTGDNITNPYNIYNLQVYRLYVEKL